MCSSIKGRIKRYHHNSIYFIQAFKIYIKRRFFFIKTYHRFKYMIILLQTIIELLNYSSPKYFPGFLAGPSEIHAEWGIKSTLDLKSNCLRPWPATFVWGKTIDKHNIALELWVWFKLWAGIRADHILHLVSPYPAGLPSSHCTQSVYDQHSLALCPIFSSLKCSQ